MSHKQRFGGEGQDWDSDGSQESYPTRKKAHKTRKIERRFVGTCKALEKDYLRLTTFPKEEDVRPLRILKKALKHIKHKYKEEEDFEWTNEQLKSVRQDLTVQNIRNTFVIEVYEMHARLLLENGDLNEFNQCQSMIRSLTSPSENNLEETSLRQSSQSTDEFFAYRILYSLVQKSSADLHDGIAYSRSTVQEEPSLPSTQHTMEVVSAVSHSNYKAFFRLYHSAPHLSAYLMDFLLNRIRNAAFSRIVVAYRPAITVEYIQHALGFQDYEEARQFLKKNGAVFVEKNGLPISVDCKASSIRTRCVS